MTWPFGIEDIDACLSFRNERVSPGDAERQLRTVKETIHRLQTQPGIILADEVGMGKTFVALGVAAMAALADRGRNPVVVMVPSSLHRKWPRDFDVFCSLVFKHEKGLRLRKASADTGLEFFRLIDDEKRTRPHIIFLKHGAFHTQNIDQWIRFALIKRAMHGMHLGKRRQALPRFAARLLRTQSTYGDENLYSRLLDTPNSEWRSVINAHSKHQLDDDPVPVAIRNLLYSSDIDLSPLRECLRDLPERESVLIDDRIAKMRDAINGVLRDIWPVTLAHARFRSPLLILDEAHHLKNPATRLASLFVTDDAQDDARTISGALDGAFERMMFLTATPFQLGHHELLNVIGRFKGIAWKTLPEHTKEQFEADLKNLGLALDQAQHRAVELDQRWRSVREEDLVGRDGSTAGLEDWWREVIEKSDQQPERIQMVFRAFGEVSQAMKHAEVMLRRWVIRHMRDRMLPNTQTPRRNRHTGRAICPGMKEEGGLPIAEEALLPFLLAARAQAVISHGRENAGRATFAEGLASSYEAFLDTRGACEIDEEATRKNGGDRRVNLYLDKLRSTLPAGPAYARHPKIAPLIERVLELWGHGEKVVVFCHYRETGRALVRHLSSAMSFKLWEDASKRLGLDRETVRKAVADFGARFDSDGGMRAPLDEELNRRLAPYPELTEDEREKIRDVVRRFVRTPIFVARYFDVQARSGERALRGAFEGRDASGISLESKIDSFLQFIAKRCEASEREEYLDALSRMQPGVRGELLSDAADDLNQLGIREVMPNIRLANGLVKQETRQRLMLAFNAPFFPEILVASSVLAEGVDLHLNCRYLIHHDLSWNPSTLEQRTGRVDRIGAKAEAVSKPIEVYMPFIGGTQDEKQYRVVLDRERWFQVLMGENYRTDEYATEKLAQRVPLPETAASHLAFDLSVS